MVKSINMKKKRKSKNQPTVKHLHIVCRHVGEMEKAGITENHAIRILELLTDVYAKLMNGGSASPHSVNQVSLRSIAALHWLRNNPKIKPGGYLVVEHGTPRRGFARKVLNLYRRKKLNEKTMDILVKKHWKLAVITVNENNRLNKIARSSIFKTPEARWQAARIRFPKLNKKQNG